MANICPSLAGLAHRKSTNSSLKLYLLCLESEVRSSDFRAHGFKVTYFKRDLKASVFYYNLSSSLEIKKVN